MPVQKSSYNLRQKAGETAAPYVGEKEKSAKNTPAKGQAPQQHSKPSSPTKDRPASPDKAAGGSAGGSRHATPARPTSPGKVSSSSPAAASPLKGKDHHTPAQIAMLEEIKSSKGEWAKSKGKVAAQVIQHGTQIQTKLLQHHVKPVVKHEVTVVGSPVRSGPPSPSRDHPMRDRTPSPTKAAPGAAGASPRDRDHPHKESQSPRKEGAHSPQQQRAASPSKIPVHHGGVGKAAAPKKLDPETVKKGLEHAGATVAGAPKSPAKHGKPSA